LWAVVGLGNPGKQYAATRHNIGFTLVKKVAKERKLKLRKRRFLSKIVEFERNENRVLLAIPQTYMNNSGLAVKKILEGRDVHPQCLLVVYDDLDIPLGEIRVRKRGGPGTHKGMISVIREIGVTEFPRIRIGIGPLPEGNDAVDYVLSPFDRAEEPLRTSGLIKAGEALDMILDGKGEEAMTLYNQKGKTRTE
jgi:PTH1 family peptidyl-tRNA hydrolase